MSTTTPIGSPSVARRGIFLGRRDHSASQETPSNGDVPRVASHSVGITTPPKLQNGDSSVQNQTNHVPTPPTRSAAVSEPTAAEAKQIVAAPPKITTRVTARGYTKPLPKFMATLRPGLMPELNGTDQNVIPNPNTAPVAPVPTVPVAVEPKLPAVPPRTPSVKQPLSNGVPKRTFSAGVKPPAVQAKTPTGTTTTGFVRTTSGPANPQRKVSRGSTSIASPKKGLAREPELKKSQDATATVGTQPSITNGYGTNPRQSAPVLSPTAVPPPVPKRHVRGNTSTSVTSNTNRTGQLTAAYEAQRKPSNERRVVSAYYGSNNVVRKSSRDQSSTTRPPSTVNGSTTRKPSKGASTMQNGNSTTSTPSAAKRQSRESESQPGHARTSYIPVSAANPKRKPSRDQGVTGAHSKAPAKVAPHTSPRKVEFTDTIQSNGPPPVPSPRKASVVPKLALGNVQKVHPEITSDPSRAVEPVVPKIQAPNTARDRTRTQFVDDRPAMIEPTPGPMYSSFVATTHGAVNTPKKVPPSPRSNTISGKSGIKTRFVGPKTPNRNLSPQEQKAIPTKLRKRTFSVSRKKPKKVVLTSVASNNTQKRTTALLPKGVLISNQNFTNSVTVSTISNNESKVIDSLSMLLAWAAHQSSLYCIYANGSVVFNTVAEKASAIRSFIPAMKPSTNQTGEQKRIQNCVLLATEQHLVAIVNFVSESHHTFACWNTARLGNDPEVFDLNLQYDNKIFYPLHLCSSMDGNIVALSSGEIVLVYLCNAEKAPKQLCELNIKGASAYKAWQLDVSIDATVKPIQVGGHIVDSVLIFGDNDGKVSVLDTFGRQLCTGSLPRQSSHETPSPKLLSPRRASPVQKPTISQRVTCFHVVRGTRMFFAGHEDGTVSLWLFDQEEGNCILSPLKSYQMQGPVQDICIDYKVQINPGSNLMVSIRKSANEHPTVLFLELPKFLREIVQKNIMQP